MHVHKLTNHFLVRTVVVESLCEQPTNDKRIRVINSHDYVGILKHMLIFTHSKRGSRGAARAAKPLRWSVQ